jgi:hypothetical protein
VIRLIPAVFSMLRVWLEKAFPKQLLDYGPDQPGIKN